MDRDGDGEEAFEDGSRYEGQYRAGMKHGRGTFTWADGCRYEGDFLDDDILGFGSYFWNDGREYAGQWAHNRMSGQGAFTWTDGRKYVGEYSNDVKHGQGVFTWTDGCEYDGEWKDGKQHGLGVWQFANGDLRRGEWKDGARVWWTSQVYREGNNADLNDDARKGKEENNVSTNYAQERADGPPHPSHVLLASVDVRVEEELASEVGRRVLAASSRGGASRSLRARLNMLDTYLFVFRKR
eukprot:CAMPEP_0194522290 /NCGR_PEP_ID=MMETSP0253-20130528/56837_1 /TAXON_ID=2966 /ORGANISM="Noctiluca scintillans" /LENGTH=239 /DNA_ID=CAMNT_0039366721 /DNA_START=60 /DNA_END=776 /DNA_ORIENTATION=-